MKRFKRIRFANAYIICSVIISFIMLCRESHIVGDEKYIFDLVMSMLTVTSVFAILGAGYKGEPLVPFVVMLAVKLVLIVFLVIFEKSAVSAVIMVLDLLFINMKEFFFFYAEMDYNASAGLAYFISSVYPIIIFTISKEIIGKRAVQKAIA